ncbi:MAG: elongation factor P [Candidatus Omnitrophica bacterium]|nr:elongation factor P [Candidatus Omnitrophota bacterium]
MVQITANELEKKIYLLLEGQPHMVLEVQFTTPSARGASALAKVRVRNLLTGAVQDKTFKTGEKFNVPDVEKIPAVFLYAANTDYHFMDNTTYEEFELTGEKLGEQKYYLKENTELQALKYNGAVISLELPAVVELRVIQTDPPLKGASASGRSTKKAILETGLEVQVPLYIEPGTTVRVNTQTGEVTGRAG